MSSPETPNTLSPGQKIIGLYRDIQEADRQATRLYTSRPEGLRKIYNESMLGALSIGAEDEIVILSEQQQAEIADNARQSHAKRLRLWENWNNADEAKEEAAERFYDFARQYTGRRVLVEALEDDYYGAIEKDVKSNGEGRSVKRAKGKLFIQNYGLDAAIKVIGRGASPMYDIHPLDYSSLKPRVSIEFKD